MNKKLSSSKEIVDALGRDLIRDHMRCTSTALSNHYVSGRFPSAWWYGLKQLADQNGVEISEAAFNWREPVNKKGHEHTAA